MIDEKKIRALGDPKRAHANQRFFKTGVGEYGEGDLFLGITMPTLRQIAKQYKEATYEEIKKLLFSPYHEERALALVLLVNRYKSSKASQEQEEVFNFYVRHRKQINNWDLVDISVQHIVGSYLLHREREMLYQWTKSESLWERRMAIVATWTFIKKQDLQTTLEIATLLLNDQHDLIHKAVGWMLRELGKRDMNLLKHYLKTHIEKLPRTTLRYAIEKMKPEERKRFLSLPK